MPILEDGQLFERYRVHRWLGGGVAGESYEAEDRILQRKVTLKLIHPWTTLPDSARRHFFREMQGISLLNHPYLATVLDYGEVDGRIYVARRYVSSGSLLSTNGRLWFHPPLPVRDAFKYAHQLAQTLQYIHQHGYVHSSLTFANVLVLRGPDAENPDEYAPFLIADAGLSHFVRRFGHPRIETLPVSAAPEQLTKRVAPASDQFALAVLLYFWLAGRPPYLGTSTEVEQQKLSETITPLSILNPGITLEQDSIIMRALMAYPEDRHPSVLAFTEALNTSLTSAIRLYAAPLNPFTPQPETPREILQTPENTAPASAETRIQPASANHERPPAVARDVPPPVQPAHSALEELLVKSQEAPEHEVASAEISDGQAEKIELIEEIEVVREEIVLFPALPETPRIDENILQAELVTTISDQPAPANTSAASTPPLETATTTGAKSEVVPLPADTSSTNAENPLTPPLAEIIPLPVEQEAAAETFLAPAERNIPAETISVPLEEEPSTATFSVSTEQEPVIEDATAPTEQEITIEFFPLSIDQEPGAENALVLAEQEFVTATEPASVEPASNTEPSLSPTEQESIAEISLAPAPSELSSTMPPTEIVPAVELPSIEPQVEVVLTPDLLPAESLDEFILTPEIPSTEPEIEVIATNEEALKQGESTVETSADSDVAGDSDLDLSPIQEAHTTSSEAYPVLDEASIAPRLIISSPYTSSSFEFLLVDEEINIGRAGASDLYLEQDNLTSRHHALLKRVGERVLIFDKRSHNGVFLNGQKIEVGRGYELADGDHIGIGNYELIFRSAPSGHVSQLI